MKILLATVVAALVFVASPHAHVTATGPIVLGAVSVTRTDVAFGAPGRKNDRSEQVWSLRDRYGHSIGRLYLSCRWLTAFERFCNAGMEMPLGQIVLAGVSPTAFDFRYAVTGGTERYVGVGGEAQFTVTGFRRMFLSVQLT